MSSVCQSSRSLDVPKLSAFQVLASLGFHSFQLGPGSNAWPERGLLSLSASQRTATEELLSLTSRLPGERLTVRQGRL